MRRLHHFDAVVHVLRHTDRVVISDFTHQILTALPSRASASQHDEKRHFRFVVHDAGLEQRGDDEDGIATCLCGFVA